MLTKRDQDDSLTVYQFQFAASCPWSFLFSSFFASYDAMNEYCGDRNVYRKLSTVDGNDNFCRLPSPLINGKLTLISLKYTYARI